MSEGDDRRAESVHLRIFNYDLSLRSPGGPERVRRAAALVDARMREISAHVTTHDAGKIAVLAALNLADELQSLREAEERRTAESAATTEAFDESQTAAPAGTTPASPTPPPPAAPQSPVDGERQSWFEAIFDDEEMRVTRRESAGSLSAKVSAKLQSLRQQTTGSGSSSGEPAATPGNENKSG